MESAPQPKPKQEKQEKSLEELQKHLNKLRNWARAVLKDKFGSEFEARNLIKGTDIEQKVRYARPEEAEKVGNLQLAETLTKSLEKLEELQKEFLDKGLTKNRIGITEHFENLSEELDSMEEYLRSKSGYFRIASPHEVPEYQ